MLYEKGMGRRWLTLFPYVLLTIAVGYLVHELQGVRWEEFRDELQGQSASRIALALLFLSLNYLVFSAYDLVAIRQLGRKIPAWQVVRTAVPSFALTNLLGYSMLTGLVFRIRDYGRYGLGLAQVSAVLAQNIEAWWIGFLFTGGWVLWPRPQSFFLIGAFVVYMTACWRSAGRTLKVKKFSLRLPDLRGGFYKTTVATADIGLTAATLYALLPSGVPLGFPEFFGLYLLAHGSGVLSLVPGGLGVIEGVLLTTLRPHAPDAAILASLLLYRLLRYVLPAVLTLIAEGRSIFDPATYKEIYEFQAASAALHARPARP